MTKTAKPATRTWMNVWIDGALIVQLEAEAAKLQMNRSQIVRALIKRWLKQRANKSPQASLEVA